MQKNKFFMMIGRDIILKSLDFHVLCSASVYALLLKLHFFFGIISDLPTIHFAPKTHLSE